MVVITHTGCIFGLFHTLVVQPVKVGQYMGYHED